MKGLFNILFPSRILFPMLMMLAGLFTSCDSLLYDDEGDCDPYYKVRFVYDMNMKFSDAFPQEVNEVTLYVIDNATGKVVWKKHESGDALKSADYLMDVDVDPGNYSLVAWCGEGHTTHFTVNDSDEKENLFCRLTARTQSDDASGYVVKDDLNRLYHGRLEAQEFPQRQGVHVYTVPLVKNTNEFHVVLQNLSGEPMNKDKFTFTITDDNGHMNWDNSLKPDELLTYHAWYTESAGAEIEVPYDTRGLQQFSAVVADLTVGRLVAGNKTRLNVYNNDTKEIIFSVPLIDYCLMVKGHYREMSDQEYLDRQDDYNMVFFLDEGYRWMDAYIYIASWKVILQNTGM